MGSRIDENDASKVLSNMIDIPTLLTNVPKFSVLGRLQ